MLGWLIDEEIRDCVARMDLDLNEDGYDRWGMSIEAAQRSLVFTRWLYRHYFRVETDGIDNVPAGRVLLIGNHSGQLPIDGMLVGTAMALEADPPRFVRAMIEKFFARQPWLNVFMTRMGQFIGLPQHAEQLLEADQAVMVFPEGERGSGKVWRERYTIVGFGTGFLRIALATGTPIAPFAVIGGEEMCVSFSRMEPLARLIGTPYIPLTPTIVPVPLPTKVRILFGEPIRFDGTGTEDDEAIADMVGQVESAVKGLIDRGLAERNSVFFG